MSPEPVVNEERPWASRLTDRRVVYAAGALVIVVAVALVLTSRTPRVNGVGPSQTGQNLTKYQRTYVDCPAKYVPLCTKMSKIPTTHVTFIKAENGRLYLRTGDNKTIVAKIQDGGQDGFFIKIS